MKKILQVLFSVFICVLGFSQGLKPIAKKIADQKLSKKSFLKVSPFTKNVSSKNASIYESEAADVTVMKLQPSELQRIVEDKPEALEVNFPYGNGEVTVQLVKNNIFTNDFQVQTDRGARAYTPGVYYQGIIKGDNSSVVAFSFFDNDVVGVASTNELGNIVVGKTTNSEDFVSYSDYKLKEKNPFTCGTDELPENIGKYSSYDPNSKKSTLTANCIRVYYEVGYGPYTQHSSDVTSTTNFVTALFNNVKTLYDNESVNIALSSMYIWTSTDPYTGQPGDILSQFRTTRTSFNGDVAQLLRTPATTSIAYVDALCSNYKYSYCGINSQNIAVPTYTWNVEAMTHEMGHNLGSPHTHGCYWNGNNTAIDGCGPAAGYDEGCDGPLPTTTKGTIMSYCHLVSSVGISFANGFGEQPGDLIRRTIDSKLCMSGDCSKACDVTVTSLVVGNVSNNGATVTINDSKSTSWKYRVSKMDGSIVQSGNTSTKVLTITGLDSNLYYKIEVGTDCSPLYQKSQIVLTGDSWCGKTITDTGGENGNYANNENWTKTFYPDSPDQKVTVTFTDFDLGSADYIIVRNGLSNGTPFQGMITGNTVPGPFESTHSSGAVTITFRSGNATTGAGFKANFSCRVLAVDDIVSSKDVVVSPNPVKNQFSLKGLSKINAVEIYDAGGKLLKQFEKDSLSKNNFDISKLIRGNYIIKVKTDKEVFTKNLIKE